MTPSFVIAASIVILAGPFLAPAVASESGAWQRYESVPTGRMLHATTYDPLRHRLIVFGGMYEPVRFEWESLGDLWALSLEGEIRWIRIETIGAAPFHHDGASLVYDSARDRVVLFGGAFTNETWALPLSGPPQWTQLAPSGDPPSGRSGHAAVYDPIRDRMIVIGGDGAADTWALSFAGSGSWTQIATAANPEAGNLDAAYDPIRDRIVVLDYWTWVLPLALGSEWEAYPSEGSHPNSSFGIMAYDPSGDRVVLDYDGTLWSATWTGSSYVWSQMTVSGSSPSTGIFPDGIYDPVGDRIIVSGGASNTREVQIDLAACSLGESPQWTEVSTPGPPASNAWIPAVRDGARDRMVVYDGADVRALPFADPTTWNPMFAIGAPPNRRSHSAICDAERDRLIVFGGTWNSGGQNDTWVYSFSTQTWTEIVPAGTLPEPRWRHTAILDPVRDRMIVYGGAGDEGVEIGDVWSLSLTGPAAWTLLSTAGGAPAARHSHVAVYDPVRDRMLVHGGLAGQYPASGEAWALELSGTPTWVALPPGPALQSHSAVYEALEDRMVVFGGNGYVTTNQVRALELAGAPSWSTLSPSGELPHARAGHAAVFDPARRRMVVFGGFWSDYQGTTYLSRSFNDVHTLSWTAPTSVDEGVDAARSSIVSIVPNPGAHTQAIELRLAGPGPWDALEVIDVAGRRVWSAQAPSTAAGLHHVAWDGRDRSGARVPAGVYFARLSGSARATRFVRIE